MRAGVCLGLFVGATLGAGALLSADVAEAASERDDWDGGYGARAEHRSDFTFGLAGGLMTGQASGFPNESDKIGVARYEADTGVGFGSGGTLYLGGALADTLTVAIGTSGGSLRGNDLELSGGSFVLRVEAYPLFYESALGRDLGIAFQFGAGGLAMKKGDEERANGGNMATLGAGLFYEIFHFGSFAAGPSLDYLYLYSPSLEVHLASLGGRIAFYGGP